MVKDCSIDKSDCDYKPKMNLLAYIIAHLFVLCLKLSVLRSEEVSDFYKFEVNDIEGNTVSLEQYRGKVIIFIYSNIYMCVSHIHFFFFLHTGVLSSECG